MDIEPTKVSMWKDLEHNVHSTMADARVANVKILEEREYRRKELIVQKHVEVAFDDWLKYTEQDKACYMREGAHKMVWYWLKHGFLKDKLFEEKDGD